MAPINDTLEKRLETYQAFIKQMKAETQVSVEDVFAIFSGEAAKSQLDIVIIVDQGASNEEKESAAVLQRNCRS